MGQPGTKDGLGHEVVMGTIYGYSTDSSGITTSVIGKAVKFTPTGSVTLEVVQALTGVWMNEPHPKKFDKKTVRVKPMKLFPIDPEKIWG